MKKNHLFAKLHMGGGKKPLRVVAILLFLCAAFGTSVAQTGSAQLDVSRLVGADPADIINTDNTHREYPNTAAGRERTFLLLNVGTQKFFNIGGAYGRHASLKDYGMYLWIFQISETSTADGTFNIRTRQNYDAGNNQSGGNKDNKDSYVQFIDNDNLKPGVYLGCQPTDESRAFGWKFEKAEGYNETTNKVYRISTYGETSSTDDRRYLTAVLGDKDGNLCEAIAGTPAESNYQSQVWKLITLTEYYKLFNESPSDLSAPIDATFLVNSPGFDFNGTNNSGWLPSGANTKANTRSGTEECYKLFTETDYDKGTKCNDNNYIYENGKYFCADIKNVHNGSLHQSVSIDKPGWYIVRCNGFTNKDGLASLFVADTYFTYVGTSEKMSTTPLNVIKDGDPQDMLAAGKAFYEGKYENEVMIHFTQEELNEYNEYNVHAAIVFGIKLEGGTTSPSGEWTVFDNFRLLYAGDDLEAPELVLDENNPDMRYLTETYYDYKNTVLHLNRSFSLNKWNTLILPVSLTYGQMKNAFGSEVLLAELYELNENSVRFKTVDCNSDADIMLKAYTPYIIKPTKAAGTNAAYTTPRLRKEANQYWLGESESITYDGEGKGYYTGGQVTIAANHYIIPEVTLYRSLFGTAFDKHWVSKTVTNASTSDMVCKGTLAKTYYVTADKKGVFYTDEGETRDNLAGDYFMNKGEMWKVPAEKQYGLKAFRCWFELTNGTDAALNSTSPAKDVLLYIDGIADNATAIEDVEADPIFSNAKAAYADGVYNIYGQRVRNGSSLEGLPEGIYIVNGKKVKK